MASVDDVIAQINAAFGRNEYPGDPWLIGSNEGCEPADEVGPFVGRTRWEDVEPAMLDGHYAALSFFSEAGFRFFLPAFLVADLRGQLQTADPVGHLTSGFHDGAVELQAGERTFLQTFGGSSLLNPYRYGAMTMEDYARYRLSIFTREEAAAIVAYLEYKHDGQEVEALRAPIVSALDRFWRERATEAPTAESLRTHVAKQFEFLEALRQQRENKARTGHE
jgi:hypothetical protein